MSNVDEDVFTDDRRWLVTALPLVLAHNSITLGAGVPAADEALEYRRSMKTTY